MTTLESFFLLTCRLSRIHTGKRSAIHNRFNFSILSIGFYVTPSSWTCKLRSWRLHVSLEGTSKHREDYDHRWSHWMRDEWLDGGCSNSRWARPCWDTSKIQVTCGLPSTHQSIHACQSHFFPLFIPGIIGQKETERKNYFPSVFTSIWLHVDISFGVFLNWFEVYSIDSP